MAGKGNHSPLRTAHLCARVLPQAKHLIYNRDVDGDESFQMSLFNTESRASTRLSEGKTRNTEFVWSNAGDRVVYSFSPAKGEGVSLALINPFEPKSNRVLAQSTGNYLKAYDWSPDDKQIAYCEFISNTVSKLGLVNAETGERRLLRGRNEKENAYFSHPRFAKNSKGLYFITDHESDIRYLAILDLAEGQLRNLTAAMKWDVDEFQLSPDGKTIAFSTNEDGLSRLYPLDTTSRQQQAVPSLPAGIVSGMIWHNNSTDLAFNFKSPRTPNDVYSLDTKTLKIERWSKSVTGSLDTEKLAAPELIRWKSFDGRQISGFLYRPPTSFTGKRPVIIEIHGGPEEQARPEYGYEDNFFSDLGTLHLVTEDYKQARALSEQCLKLAESLRSSDVPRGAWPDEYGVASALSTLAALFQREGSYPRAIDYLQQSLTLYENLDRGTMKYGFQIADTLAAVGWVYKSAAEPRQAFRYLQLALKLAKRLSLYDIEAGVLNNLGVLYLEQEDYEKADDYLTRSLKLRQTRNNQTESARVLLNFGVSAQRRGEFDRALESFQKGLKMATVASNRDVMIAAGEGIGAVLREKGQFNEALEILDRSFRLAKEIEDQTRIAEITWRRSEVFLDMGQFSRAAELAEGALRLARELRFSNLSFLSATTLGRAYLGDRKTSLAFQTFNQAIDEAEAMRHRVAGREEERQLYFENKVTAYHSLIELLAAERRPLDGLLVAERAKTRVLLEMMNPGQAGLPPLVAADLAGLVRDAKTAYLEYVVTDERVYLFVLTKTDDQQTPKVRVHSIPLKRNELTRRVEQLRRMILDRRAGLGAPLRELYELLVKPAESQLQGKTSLCIIPDGMLWELPFQALQPSDGHYLIEDFAIFHAPSLSVLNELKRRKGQTPVATSSLLALGNPITDAEVINATTSDERFAPLPEAETEVKRVAEFFPPNRSRVLIGEQASEPAFKTYASTTSILHFATHGTFDNRHPLDSFLLLAKGKGTTEDDGLLEAREILNFKLNADLVVLSACDTARGKIGAGEGVIGLSWAFFAAGCRSTLVTQWKAKSDVTSAWMIDFYQNLAENKSAKAIALRQASLKMIKTQQYQHPFYWAGFILVGNNEW
ncbi:MAG: CHAT domain-containing protein [Blastocatellia bacterium]